MKSFKAESKRLMELMVNSIYTNKEIFLREIISNASDALDKLHFLSLTDEKIRDSMKPLAIRIYIDKSSRTLTVEDNGVGMSEKELEENLGTIAKSGSFKFKEELGEKDKSDIIGQFGVGFYSAFMVSDSVSVTTKKYDSENAFVWESKGVAGYTVKPAEKDTCGTKIVMHIKPDCDDFNYSEFLETYNIKRLIKKYSDYIRYPIKMDIEKSVNTAPDGEEPKYTAVTETETVNSMVPIWQRNKKEVDDKACAQYYKEKFFDYEDPLAVIRIDAEGTVCYKAMMFIPSRLPQGYYTKAYEKGLQLYSAGVLITEKCEQLLPDYFGFVKGIADSADLSLNISREMLQHDRQLSLMEKNIEKKIKSELIKMRDNDRDKYSAFWKLFGAQIKVGICSDFGIHKDFLQDLLVFYSSSQKALVTPEEYISRMKDGQKYIYYACGSNTEQIDSLPQTELCKEKDYEILYLTQEFDEFVVQTISKVNDIEFRSVTADNSELQTEEEKDKTKKLEEENKDLLDFVTSSLKDKIVKAVISDKLKTHPVCISADGQITLEAEKYFSMLPDTENKPKAQKILELNADSNAFEALKREFKSGNKEKAAELAEILYQNAMLIAGFPIEDPVGYCDMVCKLM
ncbi:MAG: molecular chaperone HtpG [Clostridiales bacterium]|nr:molecular chaperone HtpG [Clostridiales bacterium]